MFSCLKGLVFFFFVVVRFVFGSVFFVFWMCVIILELVEEVKVRLLLFKYLVIMEVVYFSFEMLICVVGLGDGFEVFCLLVVFFVED